MRAPIPTNEVERLTALHRYDILDTPRERAFEDIARIAARVCGAPVALVSLVDESRRMVQGGAGPGRP